MDGLEGEALYVASVPGYKIKIGNTKYQAKDGVLRLPLGVSTELDAMMKGRPDIGASLRKIDLDFANKVVKAHQEQRRQAAVQGPFASTNAAQKTIDKAKKEQTPEFLTGKDSPVHIENRKPLEVEELKGMQNPSPTPGVKTTGIRGLAGRLGAEKKS